MKGQDLFKKYLNERGSYSQTLNTALMILGSVKFFEMLEEAEQAGKKLRVKELPEDITGEHYEVDII